jgi:hypothetical protein
MATDLLGEKFRGIVVSDRYSVYSHLVDHCHQFCWAHLIRDFQAMIDRGGSSGEVGVVLKQCGHELIHHWNRLQSQQIERCTFDSLIIKIFAAGFWMHCTEDRCAMNRKPQKRAGVCATSVSACSCLCITKVSRPRITRRSRLCGKQSSSESSASVRKRTPAVRISL